MTRMIIKIKSTHTSDCIRIINALYVLLNNYGALISKQFVYWLLTMLTSKSELCNHCSAHAIYQLRRHCQFILYVVVFLKLSCVSKFCRNYIYKLTANITYPSKVTILDHSFRLLVNRATYTFEYKVLYLSKNCPAP